MTKNVFLLRLYTLLFFGLISLGGLRAQEIKRVELPIPANNENYHTIPLAERGVLLVSQTGKSAYNVQRFDTSLEKIWSIDGAIDANLDFVASSYDGGSVFLLFSRYRSSIYQIVKVNIGPGFVETFTINTLDRFQITDFKTLGYGMFMGGTVRDEPVLIYTDLRTLKSKILPSAIKGANAIQSIEVDTTHQLVNVGFAVRSRKEVRIVAHTYDEMGQMYSQINVEPEDDYSFLNGHLQILNDSVKLMIGTYGYRNMQSSNNAASQGLFISKIKNDQVAFTRYHSFTEFANFFSFMSDRQQEKMERRIERKKDSGGDLKLSYRLLVHDIIPKDDQYVLVAEVFYPEYRTNNNNALGMNSMYGSPFLYGGRYGSGLYNPYLWNPMYGMRGGSYGNQIFDGFVYTHAIVANFDKEGRLLWDNSISFDNVKSMDLKEKITVQVSDADKTQLVYSKEGEITNKIIQGRQVIDGGKKVKLPTGMEGDKVRKTSTDEVSYWYGNYYLAWGEQRIVNPVGDIQSRGRRNVFYLTKISF